ncbi:BrnT family toxin [Avibacterium avium]|uniref:BrnT family toxin n=1 Tax=Avibacterium avium TaxID=751 RepID=UPI003BF824DB
MKIEFDESKNKQNIKSRQLSFQQAAELDWQQALIWQDDRFEYGEIRYSALALLGDRLHFIRFKFIPQGIRVISFRKANRREVQKYENERKKRS